MLVTLFSAIIPVRPLLGGTHCGLPLPWLIRLALAPERFPWRINGVYLVLDVVVWTLFCFAVRDLSRKFKHHESYM